MILDDVIQGRKYPLTDSNFQQACKQTLDAQGALVLEDFLSPLALAEIVTEGEAKQQLAYFSKDDHTVYLKPQDEALSADHPRNLLVKSSKGCITDDQIAEDSPLRCLYNAEEFREFLAEVLGEEQLYNYADPLSSINLHYHQDGQELGWHFDESSFAITLLIQSPEQGGEFEYIENMRDADNGEMNYAGVAEVLAGERQPKVLQASAGTLTLFRGRNAIHRVTPSRGDTTRMLVVLAYNSAPDIALSESARMTFYGRLGE